MGEKSAIETIQEKVHTLPPTERKAAEYILKNTTSVVDFTVKDLAAASNVSEATIIRMCQHLGFKGYWSLKISISQMLARFHTDNQTDESDFVRKTLLSYAKMIENMADTFDYNTLYQVVAAIRSCNTVHLIATGNTTPLIEHMSFRLGRLGVKTTFSGNHSYFMNQINLGEKDDLVIAVSTSGASKDVLDGVELARERGIPIVVITGYKNSSIASLADYVIVVKGDFSRFDVYANYSHSLELVAIDTLLDTLEDDTVIQKAIEDKKTVDLEIKSDRKI